MERTCNGCAALIRKNHKYAGCEFGIKTFTCEINPEIAPVPLEECSKPKTQKDYISQKKMCEAMCKIIDRATRTFKELHNAFALLAKKQEEEDKNNELI